MENGSVCIPCVAVEPTVARIVSVSQLNSPPTGYRRDGCSGSHRSSTIIRNIQSQCAHMEFHLPIVPPFWNKSVIQARSRGMLQKPKSAQDMFGQYKAHAEVAGKQIASRLYSIGVSLLSTF